MYYLAKIIQILATYMHFNMWGLGWLAQLYICQFKLLLVLDLNTQGSKIVKGATRMNGHSLKLCVCMFERS
jgi:hypothetical protein